MEQISTFERIRAAQPTVGRPLNQLCTPETATKILKNLAAGAYIGPAAEAAGVSYHNVRTWLRRAAEERAAGNLESPYVKFAEAIAHAEAAAEQGLLETVRISEDWRAQAFILERRHRERWGKVEQQQQPQQILVISEELATGMLEALKAATKVADQLPAIETTATKLNDSNEIDSSSS